MNRNLINPLACDVTTHHFQNIRIKHMLEIERLERTSLKKRVILRNCIVVITRTTNKERVQVIKRQNYINRFLNTRRMDIKSIH